MTVSRAAILDAAARVFSVELLLYIAMFQVVIAVLRGFSTMPSARLAIVEGMVSAVFWLAAAVSPIAADIRKDHESVLDAFNAIAAGATGAAVMCSTGSGWLIAFGINR